MRCTQSGVVSGASAYFLDCMQYDITENQEKNFNANLYLYLACVSSNEYAINSTLVSQLFILFHNKFK